MLKDKDEEIIAPRFAAVGSITNDNDVPYFQALELTIRCRKLLISIRLWENLNFPLRIRWCGAFPYKQF